MKKVIRPNVFYATFSQLFKLSIYVGVIFLTHQLISMVLGFEILGYITEVLSTLDTRTYELVSDFVIHIMLNELVFIFFPFFVLFINSVTREVKIEGDYLYLRKGFLGIIEDKVDLSYVDYYELHKDFGFLNTGSVELKVRGRWVKIDYVVDLKRAEEIIESSIPVHSFDK